MRKINILTALMLMLLLTGCAHSDGEIILEKADRTYMNGDEAASFAKTDGLADIEESVSASAAAGAASESEKILSSPEPSVLYVYVCGAVNSPGVYELPEGSRINDALEAAGGFSGEADKTYVNLAAVISDGMKLKIPTLEETAELNNNSEPVSYDETDTLIAAEDDNSRNKADSGLININTASAEQLKTLSGIGDGIAAKIISYREANGGFKTIEDIMKVSGIKEKLFSKIKDYITV